MNDDNQPIVNIIADTTATPDPSTVPVETLSEAQEEEALVEPAPVALTEDADVLESVPVSKEEDTVAPVAEPASTPAIESAPNEHFAEPVTVAPTLEPQVQEIVIEKAEPRSSADEADTTGGKPLTEEDKDAIFQNKLKDNLAGANARKQQKHEAHLQEIIDFIRRKGTMVSNQDIEEGLQILDTTVTRRLNELVHRGAVIRLGDQRHARYKLKEGV